MIRTMILALALAGVSMPASAGVWSWLFGSNAHSYGAAPPSQWEKNRCSHHATASSRASCLGGLRSHGGGSNNTTVNPNNYPDDGNWLDMMESNGRTPSYMKTDCTKINKYNRRDCSAQWRHEVNVSTHGRGLAYYSPNKELN